MGSLRVHQSMANCTASAPVRVAAEQCIVPLPVHPLLASLAVLILMLCLWVLRRIDLLRVRLRLGKLSRPEDLPPRQELESIAAALRVEWGQQQQHHHHCAPQVLARLSPTTADSIVGECVICLAPAAESPVELLPCGHSDFCAHCVVQLWEHCGVRRSLRCPLCRQAVEFVCPAFLAREAAAAAARRHAVMPMGEESHGVCVQDDVELYRRFSYAFFRQQGPPWSVRCILWLRPLTHARLLPFVVGIRIALLHITLLAYLILPNGLVHDRFSSSSGSGRSSGADSCGHTARPDRSLAGVSRPLRLLGAVLDLTMGYSDDVFVLVICVLLTGHLLQHTLFYDVADGA